MTTLDTLTQSVSPIDGTATEDIGGGLLEWIWFVFGYMAGVRER